ILVKRRAPEQITHESLRALTDRGVATIGRMRGQEYVDEYAQKVKARLKAEAAAKAAADVGATAGSSSEARS
ncbi:MAG: hypothetical protein L0L45_07230, partial [Bifidobacterium mongoliense]|nr:hypothetical protein [Bifidobacterium mongoliense]